MLSLRILNAQENFSTLPYVGRTLYVPIPFPVLYSEEIPEDVYIRVSPELTDEFFQRYPTIKTIFKGMRRRNFEWFFLINNSKRPYPIAPTGNSMPLIREGLSEDGVWYPLETLGRAFDAPGLTKIPPFSGVLILVEPLRQKIHVPIRYKVWTPNGIIYSESFQGNE